MFKDQEHLIFLMKRFLLSKLLGLREMLILRQILMKLSFTEKSNDSLTKATIDLNKGGYFLFRIFYA